MLTLLISVSLQEGTQIESFLALCLDIAWLLFGWSLIFNCSLQESIKLLNGDIGILCDLGIESVLVDLVKIFLERNVLFLSVFFD